MNTAAHGRDSVSDIAPRVFTLASDVAPPLRAFENAIYGRIPKLDVALVASDAVAPCRLKNGARAERWRAEVRLRDLVRPFDVLIASPERRPRALVLAQVFQRAPDGMANIAEALSHSDRLSASDAFVSLLLGRHIHAPPLADILERGFAIAFFCPGDVIPDHSERAPAILSSIYDGEAERPGALAGWAGLASAVRGLLANDGRYRDVPIAAWGHSRHGKAALLAGAADPNFAAVIAHQSGRFGASLTSGGAGETPLQIARAFPHWFCQSFHDQLARNEVLPVDQDALLALIAPRPILLGSASLDFWSDPRGAQRSAKLAGEAYEEQGHAGFAACGKADYAGGIVHFSRFGGHGINAADWRFFLKFLEAKFAPESSLA